MPYFRKHFNTGIELAEYYADEAKKHPKEGDAWYSWEDDRTLGMRGRDSLIKGTERFNKDIQKFVDEIWESVPVLQRMWELQPVGFFPNVPVYLTGDPNNMWRLSEETSERTPVRIWVGTTSSVAFNHEDITRRGAAVAAFALVLSQVRPVHITPYTSYGIAYEYSTDPTLDRGDVILSWDLQTSPLILSEVAASLCDPMIARYLTRDLAHVVQREYRGRWVRGFDNEEVMRVKLGAQKEDIWLRNIYATDPLVRDPAAWVRKELRRYTKED